MHPQMTLSCLCKAQEDTGVPLLSPGHVQTVLQKTPPTGEGVAAEASRHRRNELANVLNFRIGHFAGEATRTWEERAVSPAIPFSWCGHTVSGIFGFAETQAGNPI